MGVHRRSTPKHRAFAEAGNVDRDALPRIIRQGAKLRARKPMPCNSLNFMQHPGTSEDSLQMKTHPPPSPYPAVADYPLVDPSAWKTLPRKLERLPMPEIDPANIIAVKPEYEGISPNNIRDGWTWMGYKALGMYQKLYVDPPKTALPAAFNVIVKDQGLATCATHVFGVYPPVPMKYLNEPMARQWAAGLKYRREVALFPTHAAIWAAHCARLPRMQPCSDVPIKLVREPGEKEAASCVRLPVVPVSVPYPPKFFAIELFVYTKLKPLFIAHLLPCPVGYYVQREATIGSESYEQLVQNMVKAYNLHDLCRLAKNVYGTYQNMIVLGMVDDGIWFALDFAWQAVLKAMSIVEMQGNKPPGLARGRR